MLEAHSLILLRYGGERRVETEVIFHAEAAVGAVEG
jgi:hypothetical protein